MANIGLKRSVHSIKYMMFQTLYYAVIIIFFSLFTSSKKGPKMKIFSIEDLFIIVHQGNGLLCVSLRLSNFVILFLCLIELGHCELLTTGESCTALLQKTLHFILEIRAYGLEWMTDVFIVKVWVTALTIPPTLFFLVHYHSISLVFSLPFLVLCFLPAVISHRKTFDFCLWSLPLSLFFNIVWCQIGLKFNFLTVDLFIYLFFWGKHF